MNWFWVISKCTSRLLSKYIPRERGGTKGTGVLHVTPRLQERKIPLVVIENRFVKTVVVADDVFRRAILGAAEEGLQKGQKRSAKTA
ncbi:MAG: hypothetical protein R3B54_07845 [Bdellovibrionota bacterium]